VSITASYEGDSNNPPSAGSTELALTPAIYIRADGSIHPSAAPISTVDNTTYTLTGDIVEESVVVQRDNIILDGNDWALEKNTYEWIENGIDITSMNNVTVENLSIRGSFTDGIVLTHSSNIKLINNTLTGSYFGISIDSSLGNMVLDNNLTGNTFYAIWLTSSSNNTISGNNEKTNEWGALLDSSSDNALTDNIINGGYYGFYLESSNSNTITGNNISGSGTGIYLTSSSNNTIYHNNFIGNLNQATTDPDSSNVWDNGYPSGGNYWSDYVGVDEKSGRNQNLLGSDGIGDTAYAINFNNTDNYPLMQPWLPRTQSSASVVCSTNSTVSGTPITCTVTISGSNPTGIVTWSTNSSGRFHPSNSTLSNGSCSTTYTDNSKGAVVITASYSGDSNNTQSSVSVTLFIKNQATDWGSIEKYLALAGAVLIIIAVSTLIFTKRRKR
jgi:parallel beta-helix repeat protein